jgi:hypothetical protein
VPETTIDEHGDPLDLEEKVRPSKDVVRANTPASKPISDKVRSKAQFRCRVGRRFDGPHIS